MNISSSVCWCNIWDGKSLQNVGPDVLALRQKNVIKFLDVKTNVTTYFKCENATTGLDISVYCGHNRYPFFAIAEVIMKPAIYIYKYPEMTKYNTLPKLRVTKYVDIHFTEFDLIVAVSGYPDFDICIFNFRTAVLLVQYSSQIASTAYSLIAESHQYPMFAQYSKWDSKLLCYEMTIKSSGKEFTMHRIAEISLVKKNNVSTQLFMSFGEDHRLCVVNDYGEFSTVDIAGMSLKPRWSPQSLQNEYEDLAPQAHMLTVHKGGFLITNKTKAYFIKKKGANYVLEWSIDELEMEISQYISNTNGELYGVTPLGALIAIGVENNEAKLQSITTTGEKVTEYAIVKNIKEEVLLLLLPKGMLKMVDIQQGRTVSELTVEDASTMCAHTTLALVAVGTTSANLYLISYDRVATPEILAELECNTLAIERMQFVNMTLICEDANGLYNVIQAEFKPKYTLTHFAIIDDVELTQNVLVVGYYLIEGQRILFFITRDKTAKTATELWIVYWSLKDKRLYRLEYELPAKYENATIIPAIGRSTAMEFAALRVGSVIFDIFDLSDDNKLRKISSTQTTHFAPMSGITATKHMLTWGIDGILLHFRLHKRSSKPFMVSRFVKLFFTPNILANVDECFNSRYLITHYSSGLLRVMRLPSLADNIRESTMLPLQAEEMDWLSCEQNFSNLNLVSGVVKDVEFSRADLRKREKLNKMVEEFSAKVSELIDYDMSVTGKSQGIFKKFCFNYNWLDELFAQAKKLCEAERESIEKAIVDESRIRDWIMQLIMSEALGIHYKVRAIFADANFENYALRRKADLTEFDKYRFYDFEQFRTLSIDEDLAPDEAKRETKLSTKEPTTLGEEEEEPELYKGLRDLNRFVVEGNSVFEYVMLPEFALQDKNIVTSNQIYNENVNFRYYLNNPMKLEFNKLFHEAQQLKQETIDNVLGTNAALYTIYDNMNIMLRLLGMETFVPPELSIPKWAKDEVVASILEVDDSEIKAINRRKRKTIDTGGKRGRMLLWGLEFWERALITMMDGVIEKLWEEEIKKNIPMPEFAQRKQPHEFSLEEQKLYRIYEEAVHQLEEDRRKYLRILHEREAKMLEVKGNQIVKLNSRVSELMRLKLKYDYAMFQNRIRLSNLKAVNFKHRHWRERIAQLRDAIDTLTEYIMVYQKLSEYFEYTMSDVKTRLETVQGRDKAVDRQFRGNYLNSVPHASHEMTKLFRKRPKIIPKVFNSHLVCNETANKLSGKQQAQRAAFPLPSEVYDFLALIDEYDNIKNCPQSVDQKSWEQFIKLRRQKIESELRTKAVLYVQNDVSNDLSRKIKDLSDLKESKANDQKVLNEAVQKYIESRRNTTLQLTLKLGQVEVDIMGKLENLDGAILMNFNDINDVNEMIKDAGNKKLKAMMRVAVFRRQVIYKEWEHKIHKANIEYLKYMLDAVEKCKVSMEFLNILRNWEKVKKEREKFMAEGAIERVIEQKIMAFRKNLDRINIKIDLVKDNTLKMKRDNHAINQSIERMRVDVALSSIKRDFMMEDKLQREQRERMQRVKQHRNLLDAVRSDYARILELNTILELLRLRTYPTLAPAPPQCPERYY